MWSVVHFPLTLGKQNKEALPVTHPLKSPSYAVSMTGHSWDRLDMEDRCSCLLSQLSCWGRRSATPSQTQKQESCLGPSSHELNTGCVTGMPEHCLVSP